MPFYDIFDESSIYLESIWLTNEEFDLYQKLNPTHHLEHTDELYEEFDDEEDDD